MRYLSVLGYLYHHACIMTAREELQSRMQDELAVRQGQQKEADGHDRAR